MTGDWLLTVWKDAFVTSKSTATNYTWEIMKTTEIQQKNPSFDRDSNRRPLFHKTERLVKSLISPSEKKNITS
jgi:hypothetical protein